MKIGGLNLKKFHLFLRTFILLLFVFFLSSSLTAFAHPGAKDKNNGHTCRTNCAKYGLKDGEYHLHKPGTNEIIRVDQKTRKPLSSKTPVSKPAVKAPVISKVIKANAKIQNVKVTRVIDGDTVEVLLPSNKTVIKVRLIGVNTPESTTKIEYYGKEASAYTKKRLLHKTVTLEFDVGLKDRYGRYLAYIWIGKELFNETLVKSGYANVMTIQPNVKYQSKFIAGERYARQNKKGLWKK